MPKYIDKYIQTYDINDNLFISLFCNIIDIDKASYFASINKYEILLFPIFISP